MECIKILDNFLPIDVFQELQDYCLKNDFKKVTVAEKDFLILETPPEILDYLKIDQHELHFTFIRKAHSEFDTDIRIHADGIISGKKVQKALVLYINKQEDVSINGTAFWNHVKYGAKLPYNVSEDEFDRMILKESNNENNWRKTKFVQSIPNRCLIYNSNLFHSKYPKKITSGERIVLVAFFTLKNERI